MPEVRESPGPANEILPGLWHVAGGVMRIRFQKKSTQLIKTPQREIDLVKERLKRPREILR